MAAPLVDIPTNWDPQANQQPTGLLVAPPLTRQSRLVRAPLGTPPNKKNPLFCTAAKGSPVDIPREWDPQRNLAVRALRVAFADFSAAPWQGFEKSERGPNNSSLFRPQAAVVVVAVRVPLGHPTGESFPTVDIPTDWDPRTNQQPTGLLIALPAAVPCCSNPSGS